jgi:hypothetical protein
MVAWESVRFLTAHAKTDVKNVLPLNKHHLMAFSVAYRSLKATTIRFPQTAPLPPPLQRRAKQRRN